MDEEQIEIKNEVIDKHEELQIKLKPPKEYIKSEPMITHSYFSNNSSSQKKNHLLSKNMQMKSEIPETAVESEIFVKSEPYIKPEIFVGISESDLSQEMSTVSYDPLDIVVHEEKKHLEIPRKQTYKCSICSTNTCARHCIYLFNCS